MESDICFGYVAAFNSISFVDKELENRKANFLKQQVRNHAKIVTLTVVKFIKESISTPERQSLKSLHTAHSGYWI